MDFQSRAKTVPFYPPPGSGGNPTIGDWHGLAKNSESDVWKIKNRTGFFTVEIALWISLVFLTAYGTLKISSQSYGRIQKQILKHQQPLPR